MNPLDNVLDNIKPHLVVLLGGGEVGECFYETLLCTLLGLATITVGCRVFAEINNLGMRVIKIVLMVVFTYMSGLHAYYAWSRIQQPLVISSVTDALPRASISADTLYAYLPDVWKIKEYIN